MATSLRIHRVVDRTEVEGPGARACVWVQGCTIRCPGCFNPHTWTRSGGTDMTVGALAERLLGLPDIEGVTFMGGEPFEQAAGLAELARRLRSASDLSVMTFSGHEREFLESEPWPGCTALIAQTDLLIDGPFRQDLLDTSRPWVGSSNQRYHFITGRYRHLEPDLASIPNRLEVRVQADGTVFVNGLATRADLDRLGRAVRRS